MLMPKRVKHRKQQRGRMAGKAWRGSDVSFGDYGLKAMEPCWMTARQIEAARVAMTRFIKRGGKIWVRVFPDKPITKKPQETRMGKGKGAPEAWVCVIKPGRILFEIATDQPGFTVDEPLLELGRALKLPPWLEPSREQIQTALPPLRNPDIDDADIDGPKIDAIDAPPRGDGARPRRPAAARSASS